MFIVITGLDGSGTTTIANGLHKLDCNSKLFKTPSNDYSDRNKIDEIIRLDSSVAHMLYYLSSTVYISDYIKHHCDYENNNVYVVRYLIDTVVSNRVAGIDIDLDYNIYGNELLVPDLTLFVYTDEEKRKKRISDRGKNVLDKVLDDNKKRKQFLQEYKKYLTKNTLYIDNSADNPDMIIASTYDKISRIRQKK